VLESTNRVSALTNIVFDILLAEDNTVNQKLAVKILERHKHTVEIAENGALALESFKACVGEDRPFNIILMDVSMPFMGGMEATQHIRAHKQLLGLPRTPIITLTAHAMIGDRERCLEAGMDGHDTKPLRRCDLLAAIHCLASERASARPSDAVQEQPMTLPLGAEGILVS